MTPKQEHRKLRRKAIRIQNQLKPRPSMAEAMKMASKREEPE